MRIKSITTIQDNKHRTPQFDKFKILLHNKSQKVYQRLSMGSPTITQHAYTPIFRSTLSGFISLRQDSQIELHEELLKITSIIKKNKKQSYLEYDDKNLSWDQYYGKYNDYVLQVQRNHRMKKIIQKEKKMIKQYKYRVKVIEELIKTEEGYVQDLGLIREYIKDKVVQSKLISEEDYSIIFSNIDEIYQVQKQFYQELISNKCSLYKLQCHLAEQLIKLSSKFEIYAHYFSDQPKANEIIKELEKKNEEFRILVISFKKDPKLRGLGWAGFMVKPVQRLPRYELLINDIIKHSEEEEGIKEQFLQLKDELRKSINKSNEKMSEYIRKSKLRWIQKTYCKEHGINVLNSRLYKEEKLSIIWEGNEKEVLVYLMNDQLILCEKENFEYKFFKQLQLNQLSYYLGNLHFIHQLKTRKEFNYQIGWGKHVHYFYISERVGTSLIERRFRLIDNVIDVEVIGTEERDENTIFAYTIYIICISIGQIENKVYLRFSQLKSINEFIVKELNEVKITNLVQDSWLNKNDKKLIEKRKSEIEDLILSILTNKIFRYQNDNMKEKVLRCLNLDRKFYELPQILSNMDKSVLEDVSSQKGIGRKGRYKSTVVLQHKNEEVEKTASVNENITVYLYDGNRLEMTISNNTKGYDVIIKISEQINLKNYIEFRLYECDDNQCIIRQIMDDEFVCENKTKNYLSWKKKKSLIFRKYLFLNSEYEEYQEMIDIDLKRLNLTVNQIFNDIKKRIFVFVLRDYYLFAAIWQIIEDDTDISKIIPPNILKTKSKIDWQMLTYVMKTQLLTDIPSYITYQLTVQEIQLQQTTFQSDPRIIKELSIKGQKLAAIQDDKIQASKLLIELIKQHPFYGITFFNVVITKETQSTFTQLFKCTSIYQNILLGISANGIHFIKTCKSLIIGYLSWNDYTSLQLHTGNIQIQIGADLIDFVTNQPYSILSLIEEYEYLAQQL